MISDSRPPIGATPVGRTDRDIYRLAPTMDATVLDTIATRLEFRGTDDGYAQPSQAYFGRLPLSEAGRLLALGCGTGIEVRALRRLTSPDTVIIGLDHSTTLIDRARRITADEGLSHNITYQTGDAHRVAYDDGAFDIVTLHTLISHVEDPMQVLREAHRLVRPGGTVAIFDGDYASLTFGYTDHQLGRTIEEKLVQLIVANPRIMRDMPRMLREVGLQLVEADGTLYANIGTSRFWLGAAESYGVLLGRSGLLPPQVVDHWRAYQAESAQNGTFFAASNYYTYLARRPDHQV